MLPKLFKTLQQLLFVKKYFSWLIILIALSVNTVAQGNLLVTPKRVVFDGSKRSEELNLANIGKDSATYDISFIQLRMKQDGTFENITEPDSAQNFADKYLRYFPRTVTLAPNEAQTVKVQLRRTNEMPAGEYRSHMYFRAVLNDKPLGEKDTKKDSGLSVKLIPIFGISIPVIIRQGESNTSVKLTNLSVIQNDKEPALQITFNRTGNMSVYGDVQVDHVSIQGKITHVGLVKGIAVYAPNDKRNFTIPLNKVSGIDFHSGKLHVIYSDQALQTSRFAEVDINLN